MYPNHFTYWKKRHASFLIACREGERDGTTIITGEL